ncbi:Rap1a/Tai family immunity protein [Tropicimonas marinistellae]|uniref:Rap1a/Tai family immunity protein n=1 Tax=Tropicimonas marinistellae TaxID=1739787 RepID=UPI0008312379|nr:Rap1a/Tai family immunity protein [Tropicimonas marinistellae]
MRSVLLIASLAATVVAGSSALAQGAGYSAADLLSPCQEADNDARWGAAAEAECEQYIMGFVGALKVIDAKAELGICAPDLNTADEVRWAFMRWVHGSYSQRTKLLANEALLATLQESFPCE